MKLKFMDPPLNPDLMTCPNCGEEERIGNHSHQQRRYKCHKCKKTFSETKGTILYGLHYPSWLIIVILKLLAYGCSISAIVFALEIDERTVAEWHRKAGQHAKSVQESIVCNGEVELGQVQADEIYVKKQGGKRVYPRGRRSALDGNSNECFFAPLDMGRGFNQS